MTSPAGPSNPTPPAGPGRALASLERDLRRNFAELRANLVDAYDRRDWQSMGYSSWDAYLAAEYGPFAELAAEMVAEVRP